VFCCQAVAQFLVSLGQLATTDAIPGPGRYRYHVGGAVTSYCPDARQQAPWAVHRQSTCMFGYAVLDAVLAATFLPIGEGPFAACRKRTRTVRRIANTSHSRCIELTSLGRRAAENSDDMFLQQANIIPGSCLRNEQGRLGRSWLASPRSPEHLTS
jgi:hypothetical protein